MVIAVDKVSETVALTTRPAYQQTSVYSHFQVCGQRRHKQEIKLQPVLHPVKYSDTAFLMLNNTRKRFRSRTYYEPRLNQKSFADTTYATPRTTQERFVSFLDCYADQIKRKYKTCIEIDPRTTFESSVSYPDISSLPTSSSTILQNGWHANPDLDENMNQRIPGFQEEIYDPGASQIFIPKRKEFNFSSTQDGGLLDSISDQIMVNFSNNNNNTNNYDNMVYNGYGPLNGDHSDF